MLLNLCLSSCSVDNSKALKDKDDDWVIHGQFLLTNKTENGWNSKDNKIYEASTMKAIELEELNEIDINLYNTLSNGDLMYLYMIDGEFGTNDVNWDCDVLINDKIYEINGSYAFKIAKCLVKKNNNNKTYTEETWIPDLNINIENLTPNSLYIPSYQDNSLLSDNAVVISGAGLYTVVCAQYSNGDYGLALIKKEDRNGIAYEEKIEEVVEYSGNYIAPIHNPRTDPIEENSEEEIEEDNNE